MPYWGVMVEKILWRASRKFLPNVFVDAQT
jgi:hypothetical protein